MSRIKNLHRHYVYAFLVSLAFALFETVWPIKLETFAFTEAGTGLLSMSFILIALFTSLHSHKLFNHTVHGPVLRSTMILAALLVIVSYAPTLTTFIIFGLLLSMVATIRTNGFDLMMKHVGEKHNVDVESNLYSLLNLAWLIGPLLSIPLLILFEYHTIFILSGMCILAAAMFKPMDTHKPVHHEISVSTFFKRYWVPYTLTIAVEAWWALIYLFVPLNIIRSGYPDWTVAAYLAIVILPLPVIEFFSKRFTHRYGFKLQYITGFLGLFIVTLTIPHVSFTAFIVLTLIGTMFLGLIEPLQDSYFFHIVRKQDETRAVPLYGSSFEMGSIIGRGLLAFCLLVLPLQIAVLSLSLVFFTATIISLFKVPLFSS